MVHYVKSHLSLEEYEKLGSNWKNKISNYTEEWFKNEAVKLLEYLENRIGSKAVLERIKDLDIPKRISFYSFLARVHFYETFLDEKEVTKHLKKSLSSFQYGDLDEMGKIAIYVESLVGREALISMMKKDISSFSEFDIYKLTGAFESIADIVGKEKAKVLLKENFLTFTKLDRGGVQSIIRFIEERLDSKNRKEALVDIMISDFEGFVYIDGFSIREIEMYLERKFHLQGTDFVDKMVRNNIRNFLKSTPGVGTFEKIIKRFESEIRDREMDSRAIILDILENNAKVLLHLENFEPKKILDDYLSSRCAGQFAK